MKLSRLVQPRNPLFWLMTTLNVLSMFFGWIAQTRPLNTFGLLVVGGFVLANALLGMWLAWRLMAGEPQA